MTPATPRERSPTRGLGVCLALLLATGGGCEFPIWGVNTFDGTRVTFFKAERLVQRGQHDKAITMLNMIAEKRPETPYARMVPRAIERAYIDKARTAYRNGDYARTNEAVGQLVDQTPDAALGLLEQADPGVVPSSWFHLYSSAGDADDESFGRVLQVAEHYGVDEPLRNSATAWLCGRAREFSHFTRCAEASATVSKSDVAGAVARLEEAEHSCEALISLADLCEPEVGDALRQAAEAGPIVALRSAVDEVQSAWRTTSKTAARSLKNRGRKIGRACASTEHKRARLEDRMREHALRDQMAQAIRLSQSEERYVEENRQRGRQLDGLIQQVDNKPWPRDLQESIKAELRGFQESCN